MPGLERKKEMKKSKRKRVLVKLRLLALVETEIVLLLAFVGMATSPDSYIPFGSEIYLFFRWIDGTGTDALLCFFGGVWAFMGLPALIGYSIGEL